MKLYNYIEKEIDGSLIFTQSPDPLDRKYVFEIKEIENYGDHIKYIDCCYLDENNKLEIDLVKVLAKKIEDLEFLSKTKIQELRRMLTEASALGRNDLVEEIVRTIKEVNSFTSSDFSSLKSVSDIENVVCPELTLDYEGLYSEKLYGI